MGTNDEIVSHAVDSATPIPVSASSGAQPKPTPDTVLRWIAASGDQPWFPSRHAAATNTDRDALDDPLGQLRLAELVRVATWVRGVGQGYVLTDDGAARIAKEAAVPPAETAPKASADQPSPEAPATATPATPALTAEEHAVRHFGLNMRRTLFVPLMVIANLCWFCVGAVVAVNAGHPLRTYLSTTPPMDPLHRIGAVAGSDLLHGDWWRLVSSCFVHIGVVHLLANMFALGMLGPLAEMLWGRWRLAVIYLVAGLAGSCLAMSNQPDAMLAGASGAIWGVFTSLVAWLMLFRDDLAEDAGREWARRLWLAFLLNAAVSFLPGVSWEAHLGGGVAGFVASGLLNALRFATPPRRLLALLLLLALPVVCVGGLQAAMKWGSVWVAMRDKPVAVETYNRDIVPRLERLSPGLVQDLRFRLWMTLNRQKSSRNPRTEAEVRSDLVELLATADEVASLLSTPPAGMASLDTTRAHAKEFAEARSREFRLVLALLDAPAPLSDAAWAAWHAQTREWYVACRASDAAWEHIRQK